MKKFYLLIGFISIVTLQRCSSDPTPVDTVDKIKIVSVTPTTGLVDGQSINFTIKVSYNLYKTITGTLEVGFNNSSNVSSYSMITSSEKIVNKGSGQYSFNVTTTVKNWGTAGNFEVFTILAPDPLPQSFSPYASDTFVLIPKQ